MHTHTRQHTFFTTVVIETTQYKYKTSQVINKNKRTEKFHYNFPHFAYTYCVSFKKFEVIFKDIPTPSN